MSAAVAAATAAASSLVSLPSAAATAFQQSDQSTTSYAKAAAMAAALATAAAAHTAGWCLCFLCIYNFERLCSPALVLGMPAIQICFVSKSSWLDIMRLHNGMCVFILNTTQFASHTLAGLPVAGAAAAVAAAVGVARRETLKSMLQAAGKSSGVAAGGRGTDSRQWQNAASSLTNAASDKGTETERVAGEVGMAAEREGLSSADQASASASSSASNFPASLRKLLLPSRASLQDLLQQVCVCVCVSVCLQSAKTTCYHVLPALVSCLCPCV